MPAPFTIFVMQSAHTDIGYTHPQEQIAAMYVEHYEKVLALCAATAHAPEDARFKWTCETFWQVENFLTARPERLADFLTYVRNGQIEVTANYLHYTDMIDADAFAQSLDAAVTFARTHDIPLKSAMHADINGWSWGLPDAFAARGIPYFCSMVHIDSGTDPLGVRGSVHYMWLREWGDALRPDAPFRVPQLHRWQGAQGGEVLHWLNEHYLLGNVLGLSSPQGFHADKTRYFTETDRLSVDDIYQRTQAELATYIARLQASGYTHPGVLLSTGGHYVDNSPPDDRWLSIIARWNAEHTDIVLRSCTLSEWCEWIHAQAVHLPVYRAAWPDHWAHGLGTMAAPIAQARRTQRRKATVERLVRASDDMAAHTYFAQALHYERFALEHTFNAWSTTARPASSVVAFQHAHKELNFHRSELALDEAVGRALRVMYPQGDGRTLVIDVPDKPVIIHLSAGDIPLDPATHVLCDAQGTIVPFQADHTGLPQFVCSYHAPHAGRHLLRLVPGNAVVTAGNDVRLSNDVWDMAIDPLTGGLLHLVERRSGKNWVEKHQRGFGQMIHEQVVHPLGRTAVSNGGMIRQWGIGGPMLDAWPEGPISEQTVAHTTKMTSSLRGPVFDALIWQGGSERLGKIRYEWRLYHSPALVELHIEWNKRWSEEPEAVYVAFPFAASAALLQFETSGGFFTPGYHGDGGQIPGSCNRYYTVQRAATIGNVSDHAVMWAPLDAPLVMPNDIVFDRWEVAPWQWNGFLASMPVNHYWHTNFPTSQRGLLRLRYRIASCQGASNREVAVATMMPHDALGWR